MKPHATNSHLTPPLVARASRWVTLLMLLVMTGSLPVHAADSEAMQRERSLNRILVAEREARERDQAARGSGLAGIRSGAATPGPALAKGKPAPRKPRSSARRPD